MDTPFTKSTDGDDPAEQARDLKDRIVDTGRKVGLGSLDLYEKTLKSVADMQQAVGEATQVDAVSRLAAVQANFTREMAEMYSSAGRELLKSK